MIKINDKSISSVYDETTSIDKIMKGTLKVYEAFKRLITSGVPPITLQKCKGVDLVDYKIYGDSVQGENLFVVTADLSSTTKGLTVTAKYGDDYFTLDGTVEFESNISGRIVNDMGVFEAGEYSISVHGLLSISTILDRVILTDTSGAVVVNNVTDKTPQIFTLTESTNLRLQYVISNSSSYNNKKIKVRIIKRQSITNPLKIESVGTKTSNLLDWDAMKIINATDTALRGGWIFEFGEDTDVTITHNSPEELPVGILLAKKVTNGVYGANIQLRNNTNTISLTADEKLLVFVGSASVAGSYNMLENYGITKIKVEKGNVATEYEPYGYKIPVKSHGKNLFDKTSSPIFSNSNNVSREETETGVKFINPAIQGTNPYLTKVYKVDKVENIGAKTVYVNANVTLNGVPRTIVVLGYCDEDGNNRKTVKELFITGSGNHTLNLTIDQITYAGKYLCIWLSSILYSGEITLEKGTSVEYSNLMVSIGESTYEPYTKPITTNIYLNEPLRKVNDYKDCIDFEKQKVIRNIVTHTTDTTEPWTFANLYNNYISFYAAAYRINGYGTTGNSGRLNILSDKLPTVNSTTMECVKCTGDVSSISNGLINITILKSRIGYETTDTNAQAVEKLKAWMINNPMTFVYAMNQYAEPIEEEIELPNIPTHKGTTIIDVDTSILPSDMQVKYYGKE